MPVLTSLLTLHGVQSYSHSGFRWVGGELGLALFDRGNFREVMPADAEIFENVSGVAELSDGSLCLSDALGVIHVPSGEMRKALHDPSYRVRHELFDSLDGLPGPLLMGPQGEGLVQGEKTRPWFLTTNGLAWLNPASILRNPIPPPVSIKFVTAGRELQAGIAQPISTPHRT